MKRRRAVAVGVAVAIAAIALWLLRERAATSPAAERAAEPRGGRSPMSSARHEARALPRGSIAGTVTDDTGAPIARAQVCASATSLHLPSAITRALRCAFTHDRGRSRMGDLMPPIYRLHPPPRN